MSYVLIVEDDPDMRRLITFTLSADTTLEVCGEAASADAALQIARTTTPDLVLLDHFIEGQMTGLQAAPLLKALAPNAKILLFTSHDLRTETDREPTVDGYLQKDHVMDLLTTVQHLLA